jgi:hypothetical protein
MWDCHRMTYKWVVVAKGVLGMANSGKGCRCLAKRSKDWVGVGVEWQRMSQVVGRNGTDGDRQQTGFLREGEGMATVTKRFFWWWLCWFTVSKRCFWSKRGFGRSMGF